MHGYISKIREVLQAVVFDSPSSFRWFGERPHHPFPRRVLRNCTKVQIHGLLLESLRLTLYRDFYCQGFASPRKQNRVLSTISRNAKFLGELSAANQGGGAWEAGWTVRAVQPDRSIIVEKEFAVGVGVEHARAFIRGEHTPGARVFLRTGKESIRGAPGYYVALSNVPLADYEQSQLVRVYFNLKAKGAASLVELLTTCLNRNEIPFQLKVLDNQDLYSRCDAGVLYVYKSNYPIVSHLLSGSYADFSDILKPGIPVFTKKLAPGLGLAEDPSNHQSFGQDRCGVLAEGIIRAAENGRLSMDKRVDIVDEVFRLSGVNLQTPYLNSGSTDLYEFAIARAPPQPPSPAQLKHHDRMSTVCMIAEQLCAEAIWSGDRCNWLGSEVQGNPSDRSGLRLTTRALGPELYAGSSGVGLFLAEAYRVTGEPIFRRTAYGAIRHALSRIQSVPLSKQIGLFTGLVGIALAAGRVGRCCEDDFYCEQAKDLMLKTMLESSDDRECDLLSGRAGAIVGLLALSGLLEFNPLLHFASNLGDELLQKVQVSDRGASWPAMGSVSEPHLTGFSHGAAGVAYALLELSHSIGGATRYQSVAEEAFKYERSWFDPNEANWPHFNGEGRVRDRIGRGHTFDSHWCHGAPGIALSRLRAFRLLGNPQHRVEALVGLETTKRALLMWLASDSGNFSLCHGFAGNAEILRYATEVIPEDSKVIAYTQLHEKIERYGIITYSSSDGRWSSGTSFEDHPGFMIGLAGIGHFYLRLCDPSTPSILLLEPEKWRFSVV
jgi:hypothetical protein